MWLLGVQTGAPKYGTEDRAKVLEMRRSARCICSRAEVIQWKIYFLNFIIT
jgi:hypothetical protein